MPCCWADGCSAVGGIDGFERRVPSGPPSALEAFDGAAAVAYAELYAARRHVGRPAGTVDLMIASVARVHGASVVTRDSGGFDGCGLTVIDPWTAS